MLDQAKDAAAAGGQEEAVERGELSGVSWPGSRAARSSRMMIGSDYTSSAKRYNLMANVLCPHRVANCR